jgi:hypothetical protein
MFSYDLKTQIIRGTILSSSTKFPNINITIELTTRLYLNHHFMTIEIFYEYVREISMTRVIFPTSRELGLLLLIFIIFIEKQG